MKEIPFDPHDRETLARLQQMPVFGAMDEERLSKVLGMATLRRYEKDETIIREGDTDQTVYFLIMGSCSVDVEGVKVSSISEIGDMFGEMGIIDKQPRSATVRPEKPVLCLVLDSHFMERMEGVDKLAAEALFYRIFSETLAMRLRAANARILFLEDKLKESTREHPWR
ncbi:cyclic nucleotide-binding domain-containing protein [uncultured Pseudodesulfovibrio sp.]|uniref:cyclic nucleotide-binding domain-containing protein n=1 Tax=uncultured Pseudodesulfovibrio sp. TaxID=2035858 RepID=UPI0029C8C20B|nr:cyclic nucleotide-binding domain-containing protein [uncultured Pseudodesulfovibrio sp.]